ncbi:TPA: terpene cyclase/mutase family protein [Thermoplasmata archaeon]|nr:terpene cyclase/mutase family protein [Thermoplasmata archaeon]
MLDEIRKAVEQSANKLFQVSTPPVRLWLLTDAMGKDSSDAMVQRTLRECESYPPKVRLLNSLREDGTWQISKQRKASEDIGPGPPIGWTYVTMLRNLHALGDMFTRPDEGNVETSLDRLLGWQNDEGFIPGPWSATYPMPHYNGYALRNLIQFGKEDDQRTRRLTGWLQSMQRHDGGWNIPYVQDVKYRPEYRHMKMKAFEGLLEKGEIPSYDPREHSDVPSCIWSTMMVVRGLAWSKRLRDTRELRMGADFFLDRFFKRNHHPSLLQSEKNWTRLKYPTYLGSGLCALDILTVMGYGPEDERMEKPIRWLLSERSKDGLWYRSERPHPDADLWITVTAICVLSRYADVF